MTDFLDRRRVEPGLQLAPVLPLPEVNDILVIDDRIGGVTWRGIVTKVDDDGVTHLQPITDIESTGAEARQMINDARGLRDAPARQVNVVDILDGDGVQYVVGWDPADGGRVVVSARTHDGDHVLVDQAAEVALGLGKLIQTAARTMTGKRR